MIYETWEDLVFNTVICYKLKTNKLILFQGSYARVLRDFIHGGTNLNIYCTRTGFNQFILKSQKLFEQTMRLLL